jgi:hypothetical protein
MKKARTSIFKNELRYKSVMTLQLIGALLNVSRINM